MIYIQYMQRERRSIKPYTVLTQLCVLFRMAFVVDDFSVGWNRVKIFFLWAEYHGVESEDVRSRTDDVS